MLYVDLTDLYQYARSHSTPSGIQRTCIEILLTGVFADEIERGEVRPVIFDVQKGHFRHCDHREVVAQFPRIAEFHAVPQRSRIRKAVITSIPRSLRPYVIEHDRKKRRLADRLFLSRQPAAMRRGDTLLTIGAGWTTMQAQRMALDSGLRLGIINYDVIPILYPNFFPPDDPNVIPYLDWIRTVAGRAHFVFSISQFAQSSYRRLFPERVHRQSLQVVRLGGAHRSVAARIRRPDLDNPFVLNVSTIEIRKNQLGLLKLWKRLIDEHFPVPRLVIVGRKGWMSDSFFAFLESTEALGDKVEVLRDISDDRLADLYSSALFTVFPSFAEGWGLPVAESLAHGTPCVASNTTAIPEVGGDFADYFDPYDEGAMYTKIKEWLLGGDRMIDASRKIERFYEPSSWEYTCATLLSSLRQTDGENRRAAG